MKSTLQIADELELPLDAVTSTFAILAIRGGGKSYTASVVAEEMIGAGQRVVVVDPTDAWWGLRASADGSPSGLPVVIFGGDKADLPLEEHAGAAIADLVVDGSFSCILSTKHFESDASRVRFLLAFAQRLYFRNREPLHLFLDEADDYIPQNVTGEVAKLVGAWTKIIRHGRKQGLGATLITQRGASLNKNVLTQIETLLALRTTSPQDCDAIEGWIQTHGTKDERAAVLSSLRQLETGEAWVWSPAFLSVLKRVRIRARRTFNSSATPKVGERRIEPRALAPVDIEALRAALPAIEAAKEPKDAKGLRARIAELEEELRLRPAVEPERVEVHVLANGEAGTIANAAERLGELGAGIAQIGQDILAQLRALRPLGGDRHAPLIEPPEWTDLDPVPPPPPPPTPTPTLAVAHVSGLRKGAREMLRALASMHPRALTRAQVATLAGLSPQSGTFSTYLGDLRGAGYIEDNGAREVAITKAGLVAAGAVPKPQTATQLREMWSSKFRAGARRMLHVLMARYPKGLTRDELAKQVEISVESGTFSTYLGELSNNGLVEKRGRELFASATLFLGGR